MNKELEEALYTAKERCKGNTIIDEEYIWDFEDIFPFTTENIAGYIDYFDLENKSLLTVGSSGDQIINAAFKGAKDVTLLDINPYAKYYYYLKKAGMLELDFTKFKEFFRYNNYSETYRTNVEMFNKASYEKIKGTLKSLDADSYLFWDELFANFSPYDVREHLFSGAENPCFVLKENNLYLHNESDYYRTKAKMKNLEEKFITENILTVNLDRNFDNIWLSNIIYFLEEDELKQVTDKFSHNLNDDGQLMIGYLYNVSKYNTDKLNNSLKLLKDYSPFFHSFKGINGIKYKDNYHKDTVLIYQKKK